jgi:hypothetical protein
VLHIDAQVVDVLNRCVVPETFKIESIEHQSLGTEWEWENSPEVSIVVVDTSEQAVALFNR